MEHHDYPWSMSILVAYLIYMLIIVTTNQEVLCCLGDSVFINFLPAEHRCFDRLSEENLWTYNARFPPY
jgi:hypothetical protein